MPDEKKPRKPKQERTDKEQAFMAAVHFWRAHPFQEAWVEVMKKALEFKCEKTNDEHALL